MKYVLALGRPGATWHAEHAPTRNGIIFENPAAKRAQIKWEARCLAPELTR